MSHSGDISGLAMMQFKADLSSGNFDNAVCYYFELARLLAYHSQLHDLWHFQINVRKALIDYLDSSVSTAIEQSSTNQPGQALGTLHGCHAMLDLSAFTGIFQNVAYRQILDSIPSTVRIQGLAAATWKRYMRRRITAFNKKKEIDMVEKFDFGFASMLQARLRRLITKSMHYLPLAARRALAQIQYAELPTLLASAAGTLQGAVRARLLSERLNALKSACIVMPIPSVARLRRLRPKERESLLGHLHPDTLEQQEVNEGGQVANAFQDFLEARATRAATSDAEKQQASSAGAELEEAPAATRQGEVEHDGNELIVGVDQAPFVGMRVILRKAALQEFPELMEDSKGGAGTITWVDPEDLDGDGVTGDICEVEWDKTGLKSDYRTGHEGQFRLAVVQDFRNRVGKTKQEEGETVVGRDVHPVEGMRVVLRASSLKEFPELMEDSEGGPGTITWVDPEDLDGDGVTGDICQVRWDKTRSEIDYRTGYEGEFRLALFQGFRARPAGMSKEEAVVGMDVTPVEGMRVILLANALKLFPELMEDSKGGAGTITWVDPEDLDGDGVTGDICEVEWERTGLKSDYRTGYEGEFRLALTYDAETERAGEAIQRVFRGHKERKAVRTVLVAEFVRVREVEEAYGTLSAVVSLQNAIRSHHSRTKMRFRLALRAYREREDDIGADQHSPIPLKLQAVYRAHLARKDLRSYLLARLLTLRVEQGAIAEKARNEALQRHRHLGVTTRYKLRFWFWYTKTLRRFRSVGDRIQHTRELGYEWTALGQWKQHSIDAKQRARVALSLTNLIFQHLFFLPRAGGSVTRWALWTRWQGWLHRREALIRAARTQRMTAGVLRQWRSAVARAKRQLGSAFKLRAKVLFRVCTLTLREWHVTAWRRMVVRRSGWAMLPTWVEFLRYRCFRALKTNTEGGWMAATEGDISRLKLKAAYVPISKVTGTALRRLTAEKPERAHRTLRHWENDDVGAQALVAKAAAERAEREKTALEANSALFAHLRTPAAPSGDDNTPSEAGKQGPDASLSFARRSHASDSVRVKLPRSRKGGLGSGRGSEARSRSAVETETNFWKQRTRALMESANLPAAMQRAGGAATLDPGVLRPSSEWKVVDGTATSSLLQLLLPAVNKASTGAVRAWESPGVRGEGAGGGRGERGLQRKEQGGTLPWIRRQQTR